MAEMKPISYVTRDGITIHGYLTLPVGGSGKNLPLVVNPHGGPWVRDSWGFNPEVQFLASRGYAVLQMNYRGSTGYGRKFWEASFKQWGKKMQDDISDGVKYVVDQGIANAKKVCIYGGSYGGYATLAGLAFTPELYACGVDYVGVSNLFTFMKTIPAYWKPELDRLHEMVGDPDKDKELLTAASPVFHVDRIRAPVLVAQGRQDPRVNIDESNQIVAALQKRGVAVKYLIKDDEGHGFHNEENRFDFYAAMEQFLATYLR
jgi:dipeptidyl aminopeptidase/acylaminoacyl peptidase